MLGFEDDCLHFSLLLWPKVKTIWRMRRTVAKDIERFIVFFSVSTRASTFIGKRMSMSPSNQPSH